MSLIPWKREPPARQLSSFQRQFNSLFDDFFRDFPETTTFPAVTVSDTDKVIKVSAELPGMAPDDVEIRVENNLLTIKGEKKAETKEEKENFFRIERSFGSFMRQITLPSEVDAEHAEAKMDQGVLELRLPKIDGKTSRTISVKG